MTGHYTSETNRHCFFVAKAMTADGRIPGFLERRLLSFVSYPFGKFTFISW